MGSQILVSVETVDDSQIAPTVDRTWRFSAFTLVFIVLFLKFLFVLLFVAPRFLLMYGEADRTLHFSTALIATVFAYTVRLFPISALLLYAPFLAVGLILDRRFSNETNIRRWVEAFLIIGLVVTVMMLAFGYALYAPMLEATRGAVR